MTWIFVAPCGLGNLCFIAMSISYGMSKNFLGTLQSHDHFFFCWGVLFFNLWYSRNFNMARLDFLVKGLGRVSHKKPPMLKFIVGKGKGKGLDDPTFPMQFYVFDPNRALLTYSCIPPPLLLNNNSIDLFNIEKTPI